MVWFNFLILIPLITATRRFDGPSFRSNKMEGDKPILRMSPNADYAESNSDEGTQTNPPPKTKDPSLVRDLGLLVNWLVENFIYDVIPQGRRINNVVKQRGKPILRMPVDDTMDSDSDEDEDDDKVGSEIESPESPFPLSENPVQPPVESSEESEDSAGALRTKHKTKKVKEKEPNPKWVKDLKAFIKDLTAHYGLHDVLERAKPVIASLQKKHNMKIDDIDVDEYGEIHITYKEKGKRKKTTRKGKKSDET